MSRIMRGVGLQAAGTETWLLKEASLTAQAGAVTLIVGRMGSGKSTLLQLLAGLKQPSTGVVDDEADEWPTPTPNSDPSKLQMTSGYAYQYPEHQFFLPSVREELGYALKRRRLTATEKDERIREAAAACRLGEELMERSPFSLSGGQKRRLALAAVLVSRPAWLLLDEPSAGLDGDMAQWLAGQLAQWSRARRGEGGGIVIATHDLDLFLPVANSVVVLAQGRSLGQWTPGELAAQPQLLEEAGLPVPACIRLSGLAGTAGLSAAETAAGIARRMLAQREELCGAMPGPRRTRPAIGADRPAQPLARASAAGQTPSHAAAGEAAPSFSLSAAGAAQQPATPQSAGSNLSTPTASPNERLNQKQIAPASPAPGETRCMALLRGLDPRLKWFLYLLYSLLLLIRPHLVVSVAGLAVMSALAAAAGIPLGRWLKPLAPLGVFIVLAFVISGLQLPVGSSGFPLSGVRFDWQEAMVALNRLGALLPVLAGGVLFNLCTSPLSIQKGMDAIIRPIPVLGKAADPIGLSVALLFRFLRFIPGELGRFALLASVRSGDVRKPGKLRMRQLPSFFTPMLISVLAHAEELSLALESRGFRTTGSRRTNAFPLRFQKSDGVACLTGIATLVVLFFIKLLAASM